MTSNANEKPLKILQLNVSKTQQLQRNVVNVALRDGVDIIALQEISPYTFTRLHRLGGYALVCDHNGFLSQSDNPPMVCFYVRKGLRDYSKECHDHLRISLRIKLACEDGYLNIHNVYNRPSNSGGTELTVDSMYNMLEVGQHTIMLGDFNLHHHWWAGSRVGNSANRKSRECYNTFESNMDLLTPQGAITREKAPAHSQWSTLDLTLVNKDLRSRCDPVDILREWMYENGCTTGHYLGLITFQS